MMSFIEPTDADQYIPGVVYTQHVSVFQALSRKGNGSALKKGLVLFMRTYCFRHPLNRGINRKNTAFFADILSL